MPVSRLHPPIERPLSIERFYLPPALHLHIGHPTIDRQSSYEIAINAIRVIAGRTRRIVLKVVVVASWYAAKLRICQKTAGVARDYVAVGLNIRIAIQVGTTD
jgi:hypothetical protein